MTPNHRHGVDAGTPHMMGTSCQAGEQGEKLKLGKQKWEGRTQRAEGSGQRSEDRSRRTVGDLPGFCDQRVVSFLCPDADDLVPSILLGLPMKTLASIIITSVVLTVLVLRVQRLFEHPLLLFVVFLVVPWLLDRSVAWLWTRLFGLPRKRDEGVS